jgi:hypothetical protein
MEDIQPHKPVERDGFSRPCLFRVPPKTDVPTKIKTAPDSASREAESPDDGEAIRCRACGRTITRASERAEVEGAHQHTFANPQGVVFQIGCFQSAWGCALVGSATDDFTWFKGFTWRVAVCGSCLTHMGWLYASSGGSYFYGLILDRLVEHR